jgi:transcriptional regulator with XRE-family HTH domain
MADLKIFAGLHQALGHMCLTDGRARREIAEAAGINPSMLSGYCSGRLVPSIEHLDRLLVALNRRPEDLVEELRAVSETQQARVANEIAEAAVKRVLGELRQLLLLELHGLQDAKGSSQPEPMAHAREADRPRPEPIQAPALREALRDDEDGAAGGRKRQRRPKRKES